MTDTPSLALLKGQNVTATPEDLGVDGPIEAPDDIKKASQKSLEALLSDNDTPVPDGWASMPLAAKRQWVLDKLDADAAEENAATEIGDDATVGSTPPQEQQASSSTEAPFTPDEPKIAEQPSAPEADGEGMVTGKTSFADPATDTTPKKGKGKGKKKAEPGTELATSDVKTGEVVEPDILQDIVHEVENMKKEVALSLVAELSEQTDVAFFRLGGILSVVAANNWWKTEEGKYKTFREYIEQEHGLEYRKATYWISIYNALAKSGVPWSKVKEVGWTKLKEIAKVLTNDNVDQWVDTAKQVNTLTLHDMVKKEGDKEKSEDGSTLSETEKVTTKTFKVHPGQKEVIENAIAKAKQASGTDVDTVALEYICQDYLAGSSDGSKTPAQKLAVLVKSLDLEVVMHIVDEAFPDFNFTVDKNEDVSSS